MRKTNESCFYKDAGNKGAAPLSPAPQIPAEASSASLRTTFTPALDLTKPNTILHNHRASVASLRRLFAFTGTPFGFPLESPFTFTGIPKNPKVIQELLRHANLRVTMDTYVQAVTDEKRDAQTKVVRMLLPGIGKKCS
jgi:hypothetical protein